MKLRRIPPYPLRIWALAILLAGAALAAAAWRPSLQPPDALPALDLAATVPDRFGGWRALPQAARRMPR